MIRIRDSRCGGALIGRRHVVTAGHCVKAHLQNTIDDSPVRGVHVYLGEYSLYNSREPLPRQRYSVDKIHVHPYYEFTPQADRYDVAVMKLSRPVRYDVHIRPICLPKREMKIPVGSKAMVAGWGATEPDSIRRPKELQAVDVNVVDNSQCENWHASKGINVSQCNYIYLIIHSLNELYLNQIYVHLFISRYKFMTICSVRDMKMEEKMHVRGTPVDH